MKVAVHWLWHSFDRKKGVSKYLILLTLGLNLLYPGFAYSASAVEKVGSLEVLVQFPAGDRMEPWGMMMKVYKDSELFAVLDPVPRNPYVIDSLPLGHNYFVEVYVNGMFAGSGNTDLTSQTKLTITIPTPGGMRIDVFYSDGYTPVEGAMVSIKSPDGRLWGQGKTGSEGRTVRFWLQPTTLDSDHYIATISIGNNLKYEHSTIRLAAGIQDIILITPWRSSIDEVRVSVYKTVSEKVTEPDGKFLVELYDASGKKISTAQTNRKGDAFFTDLKVGDYFFHTIRERENLLHSIEDWGGQNVTLDGKLTLIKLVRNEPFVSKWQLVNNTMPSFYHTSFSTTVLNPSAYTKNLIISLILDRDQLAPYDIIQNLPLLIAGESSNSTQTKVMASKEGVYYRYIISSENGSFATDQLPWEYAFEVKGAPSANITISLPSESYFPNQRVNLTSSITNTGTFPWQFYVKHLVGSSNSTIDAANTEVFLRKGESRQLQIELTLPDTPGQYPLSAQVLPRNNSTDALSVASENITILNLPSLDALKRAPDTCKCVAFRVDDIQDYWGRDAQMDLTRIFLDANAPLTLGVIGGSLNDDKELIKFIQNSTTTGLIEVANRGWAYSDHSVMTINEQQDAVVKTNEKIRSLFGVETRTFLPPYDRFNNDTLSVMQDTGLSHLSSSIFVDKNPYPFKNGGNIFHFPQNVVSGELDPETGQWEMYPVQDMLKAITNSVKEYGFAVVVMYPGTYYHNQNGTYVYQKESVETVHTLLEAVKNEFNLVKISEIDKQGWIPENVPRDMPLYHNTMTAKGDKVVVSSSVDVSTDIDRQILFLNAKKPLEQPILLMVPEAAISQEPSVIVNGKSLPLMKWFDSDSKTWILYAGSNFQEPLQAVPEFGFTLVMFIFAFAFLPLLIMMRRSNIHSTA